MSCKAFACFLVSVPSSTVCIPKLARDAGSVSRGKPLFHECLGCCRDGILFAHKGLYSISISGHLGHVRPTVRKHGSERGMALMLECLMVNCCYLSILPSTGPTVLLSLYLCWLTSTLRTSLFICLSFPYTSELYNSTHPFIYLSTYEICTTIHKFIYSSIHIYPSSFLFFHLPTHKDIHLSIMYPNSVCPFIHLSIPLSISLTIYPSICSSCSPTLTINHLSTYLLNYQPVHPSTYSPIFSPIHPHVYYLLTYPSTHLSSYLLFIHIYPSIIHPFIDLSIRLPILLYVFLSTHPSIYPPFHLCILHPRVLLLPVVGMFH